MFNKPKLQNNNFVVILLRLKISFDCEDNNIFLINFEPDIKNIGLRGKNSAVDFDTQCGIPELMDCSSMQEFGRLLGYGFCEKYRGGDFGGR